QVAKNCGKPAMRTDCQLTLPRFHIKTAARTDFTGTYGFPFPKQVKNPGGSPYVANGTFGNIFWRSSGFKLCHSCSKSGKVMRRCRQINLAKHNNSLVVLQFSEKETHTFSLESPFCSWNDFPLSPVLDPSRAGMSATTTQFIMGRTDNLILFERSFPYAP